MAERYGAELVLLQVVAPPPPPADSGASDAAVTALRRLADEVAGERGRARVVVDADPPRAICRAAEDEKADVLVVGNIGMSGRKEFLLGNVPNRVSHNARCTVVIVNTGDVETRGLGRLLGRSR